MEQEPDSAFQEGGARLSTVQAALDSINVSPQNFFALHGPTASRRDIVANRSIFNLPLSLQERHQVQSALYSQCIGTDDNSSASSSSYPSLTPLSAVPPTASSRRSGLILRSDLIGAQDPFAEHYDAIASIKSAGWSVSQAQRQIQLDRTRLSSVKGKQPARESSDSGRNMFTRMPKLVSTSLTGTDSAEVAEPVEPEYSEERRGLPCGHVFQKGEAIWRCRDCALDDTCVQCAPCFNASRHVRDKHDVVFSVSSSSGGCCDCGDEEAWVQDVCCSYHSHSQDPQASIRPVDSASTFTRPDVAAEVAAALQSSESGDCAGLRKTLSLWIDFILIVLNHAPSEQKLFPRSFLRSSTEEAIRKVESMPDLQPRRATSSDGSHSMQSEPLRTPLPPGAYEQDGDFRLRDAADLTNDSPLTGVDTPGMKWGTLPSEPATPAPDRTRKYALILWNDEKHSFREVIDTVKEALDVTEVQARNVAERVDKQGRDVLAVSSDVNQLVIYARKMAGIDLEVTIRPAFDVYCEEIAHWMIHLIQDLVDATFYRQKSDDPSAVTADASILRLLLTSVLLDEWQSSMRNAGSFASPQMTTEYFDPSKLNRLDGLLLMDQKLWKEARGWVRGWYMGIIARKEGRRALSFRFAAMYPKIIETFILREREPEHSVMLITVQLFSVPSISSDLVRYFGFLERLLMILQAIYTGQLIPATSSLQLPPEIPSRGQASTQSTLLRQVYCRHIFYDVKYLLQSEGVQKQLVSDAEHLATFVDFLSLFNAFLPEVRQTMSHVEYESEVWVAVFSVCQLLAKQAKLFGEAFQRATPQDIVTGLNHIARKALLCSLTLQQRDPSTFDQIAFRKVAYDDESYDVLHFEVDKQATSFHHPLQWLFAEVAKCLAPLSVEESHRNLGIKDGSDIMIQVDETGLLIVLDFPLRVITKIAQVKAGLWVRNGAPTRGQATHYRDVAMRHIMYDQDLFALQSGFALLPSPGRLLVTIMDRFHVLDYFSGPSQAMEEDGIVFDERHQRFFAEEVLLLLVTLLSETSAVSNWPVEAIIRREAIHFLALSQGTYSALTRHMPEYMTSHPAFERILAQVSNFRPPDGITDLGMFELRDECFQEVDPFFYHYTRNQRERADEQLRARAKRLGRSEEDLVLVPSKTLLTPTAGLLARSIGRVFFCHAFRSLLFHGLAESSKNSSTTDAATELKGDSDAVTDALLQLVMIGIVEAEEPFVEQVLAHTHAETSSDQQVQPAVQSILDVLCDLEEKLVPKPLKAKVRWCLNAAGSDPMKAPRAARSLALRKSYQQAPAKTSSSSEAKSSASKLESKKAAAKARQQAIMKKFNAQQKALLQNLQDEASDEEKEETKAKVDRVKDMDVDGNEYPDSEAEEQPNLGSCILCQEDLSQDSPFGSLALIMPSRIIRTTPRNNLSALKEVIDMPLSLDRDEVGHEARHATKHRDPAQSDDYKPQAASGSSSGGFPREDHKSGLNATTCGHLMHVRCFDGYNRSVEQRHASQIARNHAEDLTNNEFVCPLCKSLGNVILPVPRVRRSGKTSKGQAGAGAGPASGLGSQVLDTSAVGDWLRKINIDILKSSGSQTGPSVQESTTGTGCYTSWFADSALPILWDSPSNISLPEGVDDATMTMLERFMNVLKPLATSTRPQRVAWQSRTILAPISRKLYLPEELVAYTLSVLEVSQRGQSPRSEGGGSSGSVSKGLNDTSVNLLRSLIFCLRSIVAVDQLNGGSGSMSAGFGISSKAARSDRASAEGHRASLRQGILKRLLPHWSSDESVRFPLLLRDPLTVLVESVAIVPEYFSQITTLMYYATLTQTIFGLAQPSIWPQASASTSAGTFSRGLAHLSPSKEFSAEDKSALQECFPDVRWTVGNIVGFVGYARGNVTLGIDSLDDSSLAKMLCAYTLPFLRRAAILRRVLVGDKREVVSPTYQDVSEPVEYLRLLRDLQIIVPSEALPVRTERQAPISGIVEGWIKHCYAPLASLFRPLPINPSPLGSMAPIRAGRDEEKSSMAGMMSQNGSLAGSLGHSSSSQSHPTLQLEHPQIYELVALPTDLTRLLQYSQRTRCRRCGEVPSDPALCLLCGELVCYQTFCCMDQETERGECNQHVSDCGGNVGIFFKMKANVLFCLYNSKGSFTFSPYLDSHGEVDVGLQKGRPQTLHQKRYDELRKVWLQGGLPTLVARKLEGSMNVGGWATT